MFHNRSRGFGWSIGDYAEGLRRGRANSKGHFEPSGIQQDELIILSSQIFWKILLSSSRDFLIEVGTAEQRSLIHQNVRCT